MGYILPKDYKSICDSLNRDCPKVLCETGTYLGGITHRILESNKSKLDDTFDLYYTIEIDPVICSIASYRYKMFEKYGEYITRDLIHSNDRDFDWIGIGQYFKNRLTLFEGDSAEVLDEILPTISQSICFWLDAHSGAQKYGRGKDDVALFRELDVIKKYWIPGSVIAIDDVHLFGTIQYDKKTGMPSCDYSSITLDSVKDKLYEIDNSFLIEVISPYNMPLLICI